MRRLPDSLWGRLTLLLLGVLVVAQLLSATLHFRDRGEALRHAAGFNAAQRIAGLVQVLERLPAEEREAAVRALDLPPLRVRLDAAPPPLPAGDASTPRARVFERVLRLRLGGDRALRVAMPEAPLRPGRIWGPPGAGEGAPPGPGMGRHGAMHRLMAPPGVGFVAQVRLADGRWATFAYRLPAELARWPWDLLLALGILLAAVLGVSFLAVRWLTRPLATLAAAADELGRDIRRPPLPETGPAEVRRAARAFNTMQERIARFVEERTRILAAVSHDLKTPITRLRLRLERIEDEATRAPLERDLDEMQRLVQGALDFMRGMALQEQTRPIDMDALLDTLREEAAEMGQPVTVQGAAAAPYPGKPLALKRCLANLLDNAVRYGGGAEIEVRDGDRALTVAVADRGPGLPEEALARVFEPFYRLEPSRSPATGGTGLGLAIARNIARGHGGELVLENRTDGPGLRAVLTLPR